MKNCLFDLGHIWSHGERVQRLRVGREVEGLDTTRWNGGTWHIH